MMIVSDLACILDYSPISCKCPELATSSRNASDDTSGESNNEDRRKHISASAALCDIEQHLNKRVASLGFRNLVGISPGENEGDDHDETKERVEVRRPHNGSRYGAGRISDFFR